MNTFTTTSTTTASLSAPASGNTFIVAPAATPLAVSIERLRANLGVSDEGTVHDEFIHAALATALAQIRDVICLQPVLRETIAIEFTGNGGCQHTPRYRPMTRLTSLECWRHGGAGNGWHAISTGYRLLNEGRSGTLHYAGGFDRSTQYRATFDVGHDILPETIKQVAIEMVIVLVKNSDHKGLGEGRLGMAKLAKNFGEVAASDEFKSELSKWDRWLKLFKRP